MTVTPKRGEQRVRLRSAWELAELIRPLPQRRRPQLRRPQLLPHYPAVVEFIYNNRYATGFQVRDRLGEYMRSERTCQYQLAALVQLGCLGVAPVRSTSPNFPNVYFATSKGVRLVREAYARRGVEWRAAATETARAQGASLHSILHELCLTQLALDIRRAIEDRRDLEQVFAERRYFRAEHQLRFTHQGRRRAVIPDFGFMLRVNQQTPQVFGRTTPVSPTHLLHLVELDNGTRSLSSIQDQLRQYDIWARSDEAREYLTGLYAKCDERVDRPRFRLLLIAQAKNDAAGDERRLLDLFTQALNLPAAMRNRIWLITARALRWPESSSPFADAVCVRLRDARQWLPAHRTYVANLSRAGRHNSSAERHGSLADHLASLPRHTLFPRQPRE